MTNTIALRALVAVLLAPALAGAEPLDTARPLRCVPTEVSECDLAAHCEQVEFGEASMPPLFRVDFGAKQVASVDGARTSPIGAVDVADDVLVVQGTQNGRGWSLVVERETGHMSASIAEREGAFVLAGTCSAGD
jgi:hypothetical protein